MSSGKNEYEVPIAQKTILTIPECSALTGIGQNTLEAALDKENCPFLFKVGRRKMILRKEFDEYISEFHGLEAVTEKSDVLGNFKKRFGFVDGKYYTFAPNTNAHFKNKVSTILGHVFLKGSDSNTILWNEGSEPLFDNEKAEQVRKNSGIEVDNSLDTIDIECGDTTLCDIVNKDDWRLYDYENGKPTGAYIVDSAPANTIVIAKSRAGKSQRFIEPTLDVWSREEDKSNLFISDENGKYYAKFSKIFEDRGYDVHCLDLVSGKSNTKYNPLGSMIEALMNDNAVNYALNRENFVKIFVSDIDDSILQNGIEDVLKYTLDILSEFCYEWYFKYNKSSIWSYITISNCNKLLVELDAKNLIFKSYKDLFGGKTKPIFKIMKDLFGLDLDTEKDSDWAKVITEHSSVFMPFVEPFIRFLVDTYSEKNMEKAADEFIKFTKFHMSNFMGSSVMNIIDNAEKSNKYLNPSDFASSFWVSIHFDEGFLGSCYDSIHDIKCIWTLYSDKSCESQYEIGKKYESFVDLGNYTRYCSDIKNFDKEFKMVWLKLQVVDVDCDDECHYTFYFQINLSPDAYKYMSPEAFVSPIFNMGDMALKDEVSGNDILRIDHVASGYSFKPKAVFFIPNMNDQNGLKLMKMLISEIQNSAMMNCYDADCRKYLVGTNYMLDNFNSLFNENDMDDIETFMTIGLGVKQQMTCIFNSLTEFKWKFGDEADMMLDSKCNNFIFDISGEMDEKLMSYLKTKKSSNTGRRILNQGNMMRFKDFLLAVTVDNNVILSSEDDAMPVMI